MSDTTTETDEVVDLDPSGERYIENPDFVPDATAQFGTLDTSGTGGGSHQRLEEVTPIFDVAKVEDMKVAAKALDPNDPTPEYLVTVAEGQRLSVVDEDALKQKVASKAKEMGPVEVFGKTLSEKEAAKSGDEGVSQAEADEIETRGFSSESTEQRWPGETDEQYAARTGS